MQVRAEKGGRGRGILCIEGFGLAQALDVHAGALQVVLALQMRAPVGVTFAVARAEILADKGAFALGEIAEVDLFWLVCCHQSQLWDCVRKDPRSVSHQDYSYLFAYLAYTLFFFLFFSFFFFFFFGVFFFLS